jgi:phage/plasmid primase-like uncharacterized protein
MDAIISFQDAIQDAGLGRPDISVNNALNRFSCLQCEVEGKRRNRNAWYRYFNGRTPGGAFGCWRCGATHTWCSKKSLAVEERDEFQSHMESVKLERDKALAETYRRAKERVVWIWEHAKEANSHPYLEAKGIQSHGLKIHKGALIVPIRNEIGEFMSLQFIPPNGASLSKRFLKGGETAGGFYILGSLSDRIFIGEGYATMASCFEATGTGCVVAFNAGNLLSVAKAVRKQHPNAEIILAADNDQWTDGNPGVTRAKEAALAIGGKLAVPKFEDLTTRPTDFNDLHQQEGLPAVSDQLSAGAPVQAEESSQEAVARLAKMSAAKYEDERISAAKRLGWRYSVLDKEVEKERLRLRQEKAAHSEEVKPAIECPTLKGDDPIVLIKESFAGLGYGGDIKLPLLLYLCYTSRLIDFFQGMLLSHAQVVGAPASGKNYAVDTALSLFPPESYLKIDAGSPKALIYTNEDLVHRIVVFTEADSLPVGEDGTGRSLADGDSRSTAASALRNLASDGHLSFDIVEKGEDGKFVTRHIRKDGPTLLITTTTRAIGGQMGTRLWEIPIKESDEQICAALNKRASTELTREHRIPTALIEYQAYLQSKAPWDVIVPFAQGLVDGLLLGYKGIDPRIQRDYPRLLALIKAVTILRHKRRAHDANGRWVAITEDYEVVREVLGDVYATTANDGLTDDVRAVVNAVGELQKTEIAGVTYDKVAKKLGWNKDKPRRKALVAIRHGWLINKQERGPSPLT